MNYSNLEVQEMGKLNGKIAIITGGASGIGESLTHLFVEEGATVIAADINEEALQKISTKSDRIVGMKLDVSKEENWQELVQQVENEFGRIDILINNAGVTSEKPIEQVDYADWEFLLKINGFGTMLGIKYVAPTMVKNNQGSIVNVSSVTAQVGMGLNSYTASKGSVRAISKAAATQYGRNGIRVNAVFPGVIETPMTEKLESSVEALQQINALTPLGRLGKPEEVGKAILFLASDDASYISGAELAIDGGYSAM
ncbi:NAD(P)-dependent dehydrogenase (short-subunit alcohol dehydrogenase family) [Pseudogracilibacillus auburnensis]|uniref:NAD(P)-dependent dehydrogenase (Short-subunit alcohol dehydrogenase family) n=2 Tax=Pseudogracilibacillus auburnensis TaxID=1494959 RepID=A0A2V3WB00_9BACI|nr:NAD(P)-dependent dehydrogenase (short-subunit alcohol dehydrogenase family) [Pseudogracilibacillus auburnensis]